MPRKIRPATLVDIDQIDRAAQLIRDAITILRDAGAPKAAGSARAALKSVDGARRHAWHRLNRTQKV